MQKPPNPPLIAPGLVLAGKYRVTRPLGEGAMGSVWAAMNETTQREVALKLIVRPEPEFRLRLDREARALGALKHRNIIDVYDVGQTDDGAPFLIMQLLTGETVAELLARKRRIDPPNAARIGRDVARALAAAHAVPIVHRDLKPANIFLHQEPDEPQPLVKVLDFGVAKNLVASDGLHTAVGGMIGSPLYMSPEQVRTQPDVDHRADIWALGVVLFEMLTGVRPFDGDAQRVFAGILTGEIPTVDRKVPRVDRNLSELVARCMRRNRDERFQSAAELAVLLDRFAQEPASISGISGEWPRPASTPEPYRAQTPSHPGAGGAAPPGGPGSSSGPLGPGAQGSPASHSGPYPALGASASQASALNAIADSDDAATLPLGPGAAQALIRGVIARSAAQEAAAQAQQPRQPSGEWPAQPQPRQPSGEWPAQPQPQARQPSGEWQAQRAPSGGWPQAQPLAQGSGSFPQVTPAEAQALAQRADDAAPGWARGGTVRMSQEDAAVLRRAHEAAGQRGAAPMPVPPAPPPPTDLRRTAPLPSIPGTVSTTTPLVRSSDGAAGGSPGGVAPLERRPGKGRVLAAAAGILLGLALVAGLVFFVTRSNAPSPAAPDSSAPPAVPAPPEPPPSADPSAAAPVPSASASTMATAAPTVSTGPATPPAPSPPPKPTAAPPPRPPADPCFGKTGFMLTECRRKNPSRTNPSKI